MHCCAEAIASSSLRSSSARRNYLLLLAPFRLWAWLLCVPGKGGLHTGHLFAQWLSSVSAEAALTLVLAMLQLLLPLQAHG